MVKFTGVWCCLLLAVPLVTAWLGDSNKDRVRLADVSSITLEQGRMTNARRVSAIPQLNCVGGTAGCHSYQPKVVQCQNRGSDGYDVQWECKADMDSAYRFGRIQVSCEGYDYPEDPYVLRGSCGLEYELDLTQAGHQQRQGGYHDDYYEEPPQGPYHYSNNSSFGWGKIIMLVVLGTIIYWGLKFCFSGGSGRSHTYTSTGTSYSTPTGGTGTGGSGGGGGGGFWTGAATGGLLGYFLGNRGGGYGTRRYGSSWGGGSTWGGGSWGGGGYRRTSGWSSGPRRSSGGGGGSRMTSGFGGTSRR